MLKFSTFNEHQAGRASTKSVVPSSPSLEFASPCRVHNQYPRDFERFWRPWTLRPVRKSSVATKLPSLTESKPLEMNRRARQVVFVMFVSSLVVFAVLLALPRGALNFLKG
tara:strand:+ start:477 stop:809 length:333 start_codon:yes stop_codon:yes gene_type:complete